MEEMRKQITLLSIFVLLLGSVMFWGCSNHGDAEAYYNRGNAKYVKGDLDGAIEDYTIAIEFKQDFADAYNNRAIAKYKNRNRDGAIKDFTKAIDLFIDNKDKAEAYNNRGLAKRQKGDRDGAIEDYNKAIKINPNFAEAFYNRGSAKRSMVYEANTKEEKRKWFDESIKDFEEALRLNPEFKDTKYRIKTAKHSLAEFEEEPDDAKAYYNRGITKYFNGDNDGAIKDFNKAIGLKRDYIEAYNNRGNAKMNKGYAAKTKDEKRKWFDRAIIDYKKALQLNPDYEKAKKNLKSAEKALAKLEKKRKTRIKTRR